MEVCMILPIVIVANITNFSRPMIEVNKDNVTIQQRKLLHVIVLPIINSTAFKPTNCISFKSVVYASSVPFQEFLNTRVPIIVSE